VVVGVGYSFCWVLVERRGDCQLARRCLTRCFAVLVERRVVGEMAIFVNHHNQDGRYELPHTLIRFIQTYLTYLLSNPSRLQRAALSVLLNSQSIPIPSHTDNAAEQLKQASQNTFLLVGPLLHPP